MADEAARFREFCGLLTLDSGRPFALEEFQRTMLADYFDGATETVCLLGKKQGKSTLLAAVGLFTITDRPDAEVVVAAASRDQAMLIFQQARGFVRRSPDLAELVKVHGGMRELRALRQGGRLRVIASDVETADGWLGDLAIVDEYHRHRSSDLYGVLRDGLGPRAGRLLCITTAGEDEGSPLGQLRATALQLPFVQRAEGHTYARSDDQGFAFHEWALAPGEDVHDMHVVKKANPASWWSEEALQRRHDSPSMTSAQWARFACGLWVRSEDMAITAEQWDDLHDPAAAIPANAGVIIGLDLGWVRDSTAMVPVWVDDERRVIGQAVILEPPVDERALVAGLLDLVEGRESATVVYDPNAGGRQLVQILERGEHPLQAARGIGPDRFEFVEYAQDNGPMALAAQRLEEAMRRRVIVHTGDRGLRAHVLNAVRHDLGGERWRYGRARRGGRRPIDALTALLIANSVAVAQVEDGPPVKPSFEVLI